MRASHQRCQSRQTVWYAMERRHVRMASTDPEGVPLMPGWVMLTVRFGVAPFFHTHCGSPSSSPLDLSERGRERIHRKLFFFISQYSNHQIKMPLSNFHFPFSYEKPFTHSLTQTFQVLRVWQNHPKKRLKNLWPCQGDTG